MTDSIPLTIAVEDELSETAVRHLVLQVAPHLAGGPCLRRGGREYLKKIANGLNRSAQGMPILLLTDLNSDPCPQHRISSWFNGPINDNLLFCIAVREVEAWLLADRGGFAKFLRTGIKAIPPLPESIRNAKETVVEIARRSRNREIREDLAPSQKSTAKVGPNYNGKLGEFVVSKWDYQTAMQNSPSLDRMVRKLSRYTQRS